MAFGEQSISSGGLAGSAQTSSVNACVVAECRRNTATASRAPAGMPMGGVFDLIFRAALAQTNQAKLRLHDVKPHVSM